MSSQQVKWLNISVFYNRGRWHHLLQNCFAPLLNRIRNAMTIHSFHIYLSEERGHHINLFLLLDVENRSKALDMIHADVNHFLVQHPSKNVVAGPFLKNLFMDFPNNSVRYNLAAPEIILTGEKSCFHNTGIQHAISEAMLSALADDLIDTGSMLTFSIYMLLSAIKTLHPDLTEAAIAMHELLNNDLPYQEMQVNTPIGKATQSHVWKSIFEENKEVLMDICREVWEIDKRPAVLCWIIGWEKKVHAIIDKCSSGSSVSGLTLLLCRHLGVEYTPQTVHSIYEILCETFDLITLKEHPAKMGVKIIVRTCERLKPVNGQRPGWCMENAFKLKCFKSLIDAIGHGNTPEIYLIGDKLEAETITQFQRIYPPLVIINSEENLGNQKSLHKVFGLADSFNDENAIVYFCEDDYVHNKDFYSTIINFFNTIGKKFEDVFFHPTDYPDQYTDARTRRSYIFKNNLGGWYREVDSTTFTFACTLKTYRKYSGLLKDCALKRKIGYDQAKQPVFDDVGADDGRFSEIFGYKNRFEMHDQRQTAVCFCPLPGVASHMHAGTESLHFDWKNYYSTIDIGEVIDAK